MSKFTQTVWWVVYPIKSEIGLHHFVFWPSPFLMLAFTISDCSFSKDFSSRNIPGGRGSWPEPFAGWPDGLMVRCFGSWTRMQPLNGALLQDQPVGPVCRGNEEKRILCVGSFRTNVRNLGTSPPNRFFPLVEMTPPGNDTTLWSTSLKYEEELALAGCCARLA